MTGDAGVVTADLDMSGVFGSPAAGGITVHVTCLTQRSVTCLPAYVPL